MGEVAQGGVVAVASGAAAVIVGSRAGGLGEGGEGPPVAGVAEPLVADLASLDVVRAAGGARVTGAVPANARSPFAVGEPPVDRRRSRPARGGARTGPRPGCGAQHRGQRVRRKHRSELLVPRHIDGAQHGGDHVDQFGGHGAECGLDRARVDAVPGACNALSRCSTAQDRCAVRQPQQQPDDVGSGEPPRRRVGWARR